MQEGRTNKLSKLEIEQHRMYALLLSSWACCHMTHRNRSSNMTETGCLRMCVRGRLAALRLHGQHTQQH